MHSCEDRAAGWICGRGPFPVESADAVESIISGAGRRMTERGGYLFLAALPVLLLLTGVVIEPVAVTMPGLLRIITARSLLLSDYLAIGGVGATMINAGLCGLVSIVLMKRAGIQVNGPFIAAVYTVVGFAFFGKNVYNIWPILGGVFVHTRVQRIPFRNSLLIALFGTTLAPLVSYFSFAAGLPVGTGIVLGVALGVVVGFVLPPLASHMLRFHDGFSLYNVGFTGGIVGSFFVAVFRSFRFDINAEVALVEHLDRFFEIYLGAVFVALIVLGVIVGRRSEVGLKDGIARIFRSSGRLVSDFVQIGGPGASLVNMGLFGTTLAPIAGQYGPLAGIAAGFFHLSIVMNVGVLHGGINLYNNGFAGGFVASFIVPILDALKQRRKAA